jgi:Bacterial PH domain
VSPEPYVVRRIGLPQLIPIAVFAGWLALIGVLGFDFPAWVIVAAGAYILVSVALNTERLRIDEKGIRMRPLIRIPWESVEAASADPQALRVRLRQGAPLPRGVRGAIDGEIALPARGFELDPARVDAAVRAYSDAGGSSSGTPGRGASSSGSSAGGPSG